MSLVSANSRQQKERKGPKLGGIDFKWVGLNPTKEEYDEIAEKEGFRERDVELEYFKDTEYGRYLRLQFLVKEELDEDDPNYPITDTIDFYINEDYRLSANNNFRVIDGLRNKSWVGEDEEGNLAPSAKQEEYLDLDTLVRTRGQHEADVLEFLLIITGLASRNKKIKKDNQAVLDDYDIALLDDPTLEAPELDVVRSPLDLLPEQDIFEQFFNAEEGSDEQYEAYNLIVGFLRELCEDIKNLPTVNTIKIARGMEKSDNGVYPTLYKEKFGLPGENSGTYSTAKPIWKEIENKRKYKEDKGEEFPFYFPQNLENEHWSGNESLLGGNPNTGKVKPGVPKRPGGPGMKKPGSVRKNPFK